MENILAMILAGGRVNQLDVLTENRPKSALPFGGLYRVIDFPLSNLMYSGIRRIGIPSQYRPFSLMNHIGDGSAWDMSGRNSSLHILPPFKGHRPSDWYQGSADAIFQNMDYIKNMRPEKVLILSGDHIYNMDYTRLVKFHNEADAEVTVAFKEVPFDQATRFGLGEIQAGKREGGRLLSYAEKPDYPTGTNASLTIYLFNFETLLSIYEEFANGRTFDFGKDLIPEILDRYRTYGYKFDGYWGYTNSIVEYYRTNMSLLQRDSELAPDKWQVKTNLRNRNLADREPAIIGKQARIKNSLIYNGCKIYGSVENSILFPGSYVGPDSQVRDSIIMFDSRVQEKARINQAIVDADVRVETGASIGSQDSTSFFETEDIHEDGIVLVGQRTVVPAFSAIAPGKKVQPNLLNGSFAMHNYEIKEFIG